MVECQTEFYWLFFIPRFLPNKKFCISNWFHIIYIDVQTLTWCCIICFFGIYLSWMRCPCSKHNANQIWWLRKKSKFFVALHPSLLHGTLSTNHHSGFARLEFGVFFFAIGIRLFTSLSNLLKYIGCGVFVHWVFFSIFLL